MDNPYISHADLVSKYFYDPETGIFHSRSAKNELDDPRKGRRMNDRWSVDGYVYLTFGHNEIRADRLSWFYVNQKWPNGDLEHIDGNLRNNAFSNLKIVPWKGSQLKADKEKTPRGVCRLPSGKYSARICREYNQVYLGCFDTIEDATFAYEAAKAQTDFDDLNLKRIRKRERFLDDEESDFEQDFSHDEPKIRTKGVSKQHNGTFIARIFDGKRSNSIGTFKNLEDALSAYQTEKRKMILEKRKFRDMMKDY